MIKQRQLKKTLILEYLIPLSKAFNPLFMKERKCIGLYYRHGSKNNPHPLTHRELFESLFSPGWRGTHGDHVPKLMMGFQA